MSTYLVRPLVLLCLALVATSSAAAEPPRRTDRDGDPLPPGALVRFGSARWRVPDSPFSLRYTADGKSLLVFGGTNDSLEIVHILSTAEGKRLGQLELGLVDDSDQLRWARRYISSFDSGWGAVSPDGRWLAQLGGASHHDLKDVHVCELATGKTVFKVHDDRCKLTNVQFSPDGKQLAAIEECPGDARPEEMAAGLRLWDVATGQMVRRFEPPAPEEGAGFSPTAFSFSPDGKLLAAVGHEGEKAGLIRLWDVAGSRVSWRLQGQAALRAPFAFSPDGKMFATVNATNELCLWDTTTGRTLRRLSGQIEALEALVFSPDGSRLVSGNDKGTMRLWDLTTGRQVAGYAVVSRAVLFSPDGQTLAIADAGQHIRLYEAKTGKELHTLEASFLTGASLKPSFLVATQGAGWPIAFSPDGRTLAALTTGSSVRRWSVATGEEVPLPGENVATSQAVALSPNGKLLASAGSGEVRLWEAASGKHLRRLAGSTAGGAPAGHVGNSGPWCLIFSSDSKRLAAGWGDGRVTVWDVAAAKLLWRAAAYEGAALSVVFAPGDAVLLSGGVGSQVIWWDAATGRKLRTWSPVADESESLREFVTVAPDARVAVGAVSPAGVSLWELATGKRRGIIPAGHPFLPFAPDGRSVAVAVGQEIRLIDLARGDAVRVFNAGSQVSKPTFSPDGRRLFAACGDGTLRAWETATGTCLGRLAAPVSSGSELAFAPDGQGVVTVCEDSTILLWDAVGPFTRPRPTHVGDRELMECWDALAADDATRAGASLARLAAAPQAVAFLKERLRPAGAKVTPAEELRAARAVELLEGIGGAEAGAILERMAGGTADARLTEEAKASLRRREPLPASDPLRRLRDDPREEPLPAGARARLGSLRFQHSASAVSLRYLPDGKTLLTQQFTINNPNLAPVVTLWDADTGRRRISRDAQIARFDRGGRVNGDFVDPPGGCISPDGRLVAVLSGPNESFIEVNELATGKQVIQLQDNEDPFTFLHFAPDGKTLGAIAKASKSIRLFETDGGKDVGRLTPPPAGPRSVPSMFTFSPDGQYVAAQASLAPAGAAVWVWRVAPVAVGVRLPCTSLRTGPIAFSPDGKALAVVSAGVKDRPVLRLWDPATAKPLHDLGEHNEAAESMLFSPDGRFLVVQTGKHARVWDVARRTELPAIERATGIDLLLFSPDGKTLVVGAGSTLSLLDPATGKSWRELTYHPERRGSAGLAEVSFYEAEQGLGRAAAFSPDGKVLAAVDGTGIRRWLVANGAPIDPIVNPVTAWGLAVSSDGRRIVVAGEGRVAVWDGATGKPLHTLPLEPTTSDPEPVAVCSARSPDGKRVAAATSRGRLILWDDAGKTEHDFQAHAGAVASLHFTADGRRLVTAGSDRCVVWWDAATGREVRRVALAPPGQGPSSRDSDEDDASPGVFSPDGRLFVTGGQSLQLWELASGRVRRTIATEGDALPRAFSPDGRRLAVSEGSGLRLYDISSGEELRFFSGPWTIDTAAFSPDGQLLAAARLKSLCIWDVATGTVLVAEREGHRGPHWSRVVSADGRTVRAGNGLPSLAFSADGRTLASGGSDTTVLLWDVAALVKQAAPVEPAAAELGDLWEALAGDDAGRAYQAQARLIHHPGLATVLLRERLKPAAAPDPARVARLLADLEADSFEARERAARELGEMGESIEVALRKALAGKPSPELRRQAQRLLDQLGAPVAEPARARELRAVELLETLGTAEARAVLQDLARGVPEVGLTRQAQAALRRLAARTPHR